MKTRLSIITVALIIMSACHAQKMKVANSTMPKTHTITLKKGELFLVAIADQKKGKEKLLQDYFGKIMPSAMKNGFTPLGQLHIDDVVKANNFKPNNFIGLFKWPNMQSIQAFMSDYTPEQLKKLRTPIWNEFKAHMIAIQEDKNLVMDQNKMYEVKTYWTKDMVQTNMIHKYGGKIILNQPVAGYEDLQGNKAPNQIVIIEWSNPKKADKFNKMNMLKSEREEVFYTHFTLFP
ncbi:hypothetical protein [Tenacibaculum agarivorans]|uniref:hypothetical protein n=1 Tax=Tenacibaculum agarivorans TaxID=1908389 RepID=UPI000B2C1BA8|nr:hypothetical protein [Tenacibaculum agarivorans]